MKIILINGTEKQFLVQVRNEFQSPGRWAKLIEKSVIPSMITFGMGNLKKQEH